LLSVLLRHAISAGRNDAAVALQTAINEFVEQHNQSPKPFAWKA
jgi:hypothetical protein